MLQIINNYFGIVIMMIGVICFGKVVLDKKILIPFSKFIILFLVICALHTFIYLNFTGLLKTVLVCLINMYLYKYIFNISINKAILLTLLYVIILFIPEIIELFLLTEVFKLSKEFCYDSYAGSLISNLLVCVGFIIVTYPLRKILKKILNFKLENNIQIIIYTSLVFTCTVIFFYTFIKEFRFSDNIITYIIAIIVLVSALISLIKQTIENNKLINEYDKLLEFMTTYENEIEKQRITRHETKNEFLTIKAKIQDKQKNNEIINYIDEILKEKIEVKQEEYAKFGYLPPNGIKGLCYLKIQEAKDKGLNAKINISRRIKNSNIYKLNVKEQRNLGKILGVILDNAIEGSLETKEKSIGIEAYLINNECQIIVSNSYDINKTDQYYQNKLSTKGNNRGHGLLLVKYIINNSNIFNVETNITDKLFIQKIIIKKP